MPAKKDNQRLTNKDIIDLIAKQTSLTRGQCKEFMDAYSKLFKSIVCSEYIEAGFEFPIMDILVIRFKEKKGMQVGDTYKICDLEKDEKGRFIFPKGFKKGDKIPMKTVVNEIQRPNYLQPYFRFAPSLREKIKEATKKTYIKNHKEEMADYIKWYNEQYGKDDKETIS